jgi:REP element-mobilizing transposase RayT
MSFPRAVVPGCTYLVTRRCTQRQFLLRPDEETNNAFRYCFAYAAKRARIDVVAFIANSNHYHAVVVDVEGRIPEFLETFHKLLAKHQNALRGRWENFWSSEQTSLVELIGSDDVLAKVIYTLANPVKDHLVAKVHHWPGASSRKAILHGERITARRPVRFFRRQGTMPDELEIEFVRPPGWEEMSEDVFRAKVAEELARVEVDAAAERKRLRIEIMGRKAVLAQSPTDSPHSREPRRKLNPRVAARDKWPRIEALLRLKAFRAAYARARDLWLAGLEVVFPTGTWWLRMFAAVPCAA